MSTYRYRIKPFRRLALTLAVVLTATACGVGGGETTQPAEPDPDVPSSAAISTGFPITISASNGDVVLDAMPTAIVSLSPTATEMLFAIGAGSQVVAVDEFSYYPEEAPLTDLSGYTPNIEAIAGYAPDLVVVADDIDGVIGSLEGLGIPVLQLPAVANLDEVYTQIELVGLASGHSAEATALARAMATSIEDLVAATPRPETPLTFMHEVDANLYTASSASFIGQIYSLIGLVNIADAVDSVESFGFPQLSEEYVIQADPDIIFLADAAYGESAETVAARPGWSELTAVKNGLVIPIDADISSRWGPRLVDFFEVVSAAAALAAGKS